MVANFGTFDKSIKIKILVADKELLELLKPESEYAENFEDLEDEAERIIIQAFPPERPSKTHLYTHANIDWIESCDQYEIPENVQKGVDISGKYDQLNPWKLPENHRYVMLGLRVNLTLVKCKSAFTVHYEYENTNQTTISLTLF